MLPQAQSQLKKGILILFLISLALDFYPRWKGTETPEFTTRSDDSVPQNSNNEKVYTSEGSAGYTNNFQSQETPSDTKQTRTNTGGLEIHDIHISYCVSCSYKGMYQKVADHIQQNYPMMNINGAEYPTSPQKLLLSKAFTFAQYGLIAIMIAGDAIFKALKINPPAIYYKLKEKKIMAFMMIYFLGNNIQSMLTSTGAFEVMVDGKLEFSKLATGRMPTLEDIDMILSSYP